ncbi:MAG: translation initiation factor IF-2 [Armatimonadetes bacterium]|nr:translation initiation factor IF-2 [Armatimonadota bacterium]
MGKIRVYELAKELNQTTKDFIQILSDLGVQAKSHMSVLDEASAALVRETLAEGGKPPQGKVSKPAKEAAPAALKEAKARPSPEVARPKDAHPKPAAAELHEKVETPVKAKPHVAEAQVEAQPEKEPEPPPPEPAPAPPKDKVIKVPGSITVGDFASMLGIPATELIKFLIKLGIMATINQRIGVEQAAPVAKAYGYEVEETDELEEQLSSVEKAEEAEDKAALTPRPPVVTIMGHVDHGKTSLLDAVRKTNVMASEFGGITQHIGAYQVELHGRKITFLDTPGHEAFTAMRARGAKATDVAVLVVAADDGVMPQTVEALDHAKAAGVPIIVALNKIDKPNANVDRVKQQLSDQGLIPEDWGGETVCIPVSAKLKTGISELLEMILLVADMAELKANYHKKGKGVIVEAQLDRGKGPIATVLVQEGTIKVGDALVVGNVYGKIRALINDRGERIRKATPSVPAEIIGLSSVPQAGDLLAVVADEKTARQVAMNRQIKHREARFQAQHRVTLDDLFKQIQEGEVKDLNIIVKGDVQGSVEALKQSLLQLSNENVRICAIHAGVGNVTEADIMLAAASNAIIIGFNVRIEPNVKRLAEGEKVDVRTYRVIYHALDDVRAAMEGLLEPTYEEVLVGRAEVRNIFRISKIGTIAGLYVTDGKITRDSDVRVLRGNKVMHQGKIESLKRFKDDAKEVVAGYECGLGLEKYNDLAEGDLIEAYRMEEVRAAAEKVTALER